MTTAHPHFDRERRAFINDAVEFGRESRYHLYRQHEDRLERELLATVRDPLQQLLIFVGLFEERMAARREPSEGCLLASAVQEAELFDEATHARIRRSVLIWRGRLLAKLEEVSRANPPRLEVELEAVADQMWSTVEGAFMLSRTLRSAEAVPAQLRQYRNYLELLFGAGRRY